MAPLIEVPPLFDAVVLLYHWQPVAGEAVTDSAVAVAPIHNVCVDVEG